jgi:hypothetical protein
LGSVACAAFAECAPHIFSNETADDDGSCLGFDLETLQMQLIDPNVALQEVGVRCVRVAESKYGSDAVLSIVQSGNLAVDVVDDLYLIQINQQNTCQQLASARDVLACNRDGVLTRISDDGDDCHSTKHNLHNCTKTFAGINYTLSSVVGVDQNASHNAPESTTVCIGPGYTRCDPIGRHELMAVIFLTECECHQFANVVKYISNSVLKTEIGWHLPKLGSRSVEFCLIHLFPVVPARLGSDIINIYNDKRTTIRSTVVLAQWRVLAVHDLLLLCGFEPSSLPVIVGSHAHQFIGENYALYTLTVHIWLGWSVALLVSVQPTQNQVRPMRFFSTAL